MKSLALCALVLALSACVSDDKYEALEAERDNLLTELEALHDTSKVQGIRTDGLAIIRGIASDTFDPVADNAKLQTILSADNEKTRLAAYKDDAGTVQKVLTAYQKAINAQLPAVTAAQAKVKDQESKIQALEADAQAAKSKNDVSDFKLTGVTVARKFDQDANGNSLYQAMDYMSGQKVVLLVPPDAHVTPGNEMRIYTKDLGEQPFTSTVSNEFRSYEQKEFVHVLQLPDHDQTLALQGGDSTLVPLKNQLSNLQAQLDQARRHAKIEISNALSTLTVEVQRIAGPAGCGHAGGGQVTPPGGAQADAGSGQQLYQRCMDELRAYTIAQAGKIEAQNEKAIDASCKLNPQAGVCLAQKAREAGGFLSLAEQPYAERECGF